MVCQLFQAERHFTSHFNNTDRTGNSKVGAPIRVGGGGAIVLDSQEQRRVKGGVVGEGGVSVREGGRRLGSGQKLEAGTETKDLVSLDISWVNVSRKL